MFLRNLILSVVVIGMGVGVTNLMKKTPTAVENTTLKERAILVKAQRFEPKTLDIEVQGQGLVEPAKVITVIPQVSGVIRKINPALVDGGLIKQGELLVEINPNDYQIAVIEARARVRIAEQELTLEEGRRQVAEREWKMMKKRRKTRPDQSGEARAKRIPQKYVAEANVEIARAALRRALTNQARTQIKAPFNAVVLSETVDVGQFVGPGTQIARLANTDEFWVKASIPTSELAWLNVNDNSNEAEVLFDVGQKMITRDAKFERALAQIDSVGRMSRLVISVADPLNIESDHQVNVLGRRLQLGSQVDVKVKGKQYSDLYEIPREVLRGDHQVWVFKPSQSFSEKGDRGNTGDPSGVVGVAQVGTLKLQDVKVMRYREDSVLISSGINTEDLIITSRLSSPVPNMTVQALVE